jgi:hypothetical protein
VAKVLKSWRAVASLPFVYAGWAKDFWEPFEWYLDVEKGLPTTYFMIPFKRRAGENVSGTHASRRATAYDVTDLKREMSLLRSQGCELGVHGIDSWHSVEKGRQELAVLSGATGHSAIGIRMHWLLRHTNTPLVLEKAGYAYDSTVGYNETVGYRAGTSQVFRPLGARTLLELPLHVQDGALFFPERLNLSEPEAEKRCQTLIDNAGKFGGALTVLWHDRSHGPERFWGDFYIKLVAALRSGGGWFGSAGQVVDWFRKRRQVGFEQSEVADGTAQIRLNYHGEEIQPPLRIRIYPSRRCQKRGESAGGLNTEFIDIPWNGKAADELDRQIAGRFSSALPTVALCSLS